MKQTISFAENANEVENNRPQEVEAVENHNGLTTAEYEKIKAYFTRRGLNLLCPDNLGEIMESVTYARLTEFLHLLPSAIEALTKAGQSEFIASLRPIMKCLVSIIDYNYIFADLCVFMWDIDKAQEKSIKIISSKMNIPTVKS